MISRFNVLALESDPRYEGSEYTTRVFMSIKPARDLNVGESVSERLRKLEEILATPRAADSSHATADAADSMLSFVMTDRIRRMTAELARPHHGEIDAAELVAMRLLLIEYGTALRHLRAAAKITEQRLSSAATAIKECERLSAKHT